MEKRLLFSFLLGLYVYAQSPLGTVTGVALDPSDAPVPNAKVRLANQNTGVTREAQTNQSGIYSFPNLAPGDYKLTAIASGFRTFETVVFPVAAYRTVRQDLRFELAAAATEVTVSEAATVVIQTDTPSINPVLTRKQILELPTNLRSVYNNSGDSGLTSQIMPLTIPGVVQVGAGAAWLIPGSTANAVKLKVDGIETNFGNFGSPDPVSQPSMESIEEFTANVFTTRAEFGGQGTITTVTRAGTNQYHGDLFYYLRNSALDARNTFFKTKPNQNLHDFGANLGGPIRTNKTFVFFNYEGIRGVRAYPNPPSQVTVPTVAQRNGNFGSTSLKNPFAPGSLFANNQIPATLLSPQALKAQELLFPVPNAGANTYSWTANGPEVHNIVEARIDHNFSDRQSAFLRYQWKKDDYDIPGARSVFPASSVGTSTNIRRMNFFSIGDTLSISPNMYNEFRGGVVILVSQSDADLKGQQLLDAIGITGLPSRTGIKGIPNFSISGMSTITQSLLNPVNDGHWQLSDNLTWIAGKHSVKLGVEYINWFVNRYLTTNSSLFGNYSFTGQYTGSPYADFLLGLPTSVSRIDPWPTQYNRFWDLNWFVQDDYKITPRLTLSYGLRHEYNAPVRTENGNIYSFDPASGSVVVPNDAAKKLFSPYFPSTVPVKTADEVGLPETLRHADKNNFAPRFGLSYQFDPNTVIRAGWGLYYGHFSANIAGFVSSGPYSFATSINNPASGPLYTLANPFETAGRPGSLNLSAISPNLLNAYNQQYSLSIEREVGRDIGVRISYLGSKGTQTPYQRNINQPLPSTTPFSASRRPYPLYNNIMWAESGANSLYSALQTVVTKRFSKGLLFNSSWTWAKSISEVDDTGDFELTTAIENAYDRRRDRADVYSVPRHQWMNQVLYELPLGKGKLLGGWQINALVNMATGNYLNPQFSGSDPSGTNTVGGRPDLVNPDVSYPETLSQWFDRTAFAAPPAKSGRFGNAGRNIIRGPGYVVFNAGLAKNVRFEKAGQVQVGLSFQNILNHVNYGQPNMVVNNSAGGTITGTHIFPPAGTPRTGMVNLRWSF